MEKSVSLKDVPCPSLALRVLVSFCLLGDIADSLQRCFTSPYKHPEAGESHNREVNEIGEIKSLQKSFLT